MRPAANTVMAAAIAFAAGWGLTLAQQGTPSQPPSPSNPTPRPSNPLPPPSNPLPPPSNPIPSPSNPSPQPTNPTPSQPANPTPNPNNPNPNPNNPNQPGVQPNQPGETPLQRNRTRLARPFTLQNPQDEARFTQTVQRLANMERKFQQSQADLLKRLGDVRSMTGERRENALYDLLQTMMRNQSELNDYLVQTRTAWTGDFEDAIDANPNANPDANPNNPNRPATNPAGRR